MKLYLWSQRARTGFRLCLIPLCLLLIGAMGCQSMMAAKSKKKATAAQDRFSCGESLPGRMP
ncbi:hypothetical protein [Schlesneria paludicola]|uniref:hypothetical protein n=1 Tax=Schlesneria paludicola TaxID=360056 RepID=UPI0012FC845F|nr:hypothetical protein [Schlesneria paludicola]